LAYQLVPVENPNSANADAVDNDASYQTIMEKFAFGNASTPGVYYDEENRRHLNSIKLAVAQTAQSLAEAGRKDSARKLLEHYDQNVLQSNMPYGMTSNRGNMHNVFSIHFLSACYAAEDWNLAKKVDASLKKDLEQQMGYYLSLGDNMTDEKLAMNAQNLLQSKTSDLNDRQAYFARDILSTFQLLYQIKEWEKQYAKGAPAPPGNTPLK
jgi:hypothetical protein